MQRLSRIEAQCTASLVSVLQPDTGHGTTMFVVKRDGRQEPVHFDKITARITKLSYGLNPDFCDPVSRREGLARGPSISVGPTSPACARHVRA